MKVFKRLFFVLIFPLFIIVFIFFAILDIFYYILKGEEFFTNLLIDKLEEYRVS